ncbi:MAG TPA: proline dehydrogenase family protein [Anaerolineae bacterium]|nr:proline dehydrogenase family protein [Anaerolineae bacterium]
MGKLSKQNNSLGKLRRSRRFWLIGAAVGGYLLYRNGEQWLRELLLYLSTAGWAREAVTTWPIAKDVATRFVAGETRPEAIDTTRDLNQRGFLVTLDYLGESVTTPDEAIAARDEIGYLLDDIAQSGVDSNVSLKLSQLGLKLDPQLALENMIYLLKKAKGYNNKIRMDMEESELVDITLNIYRTLRDEHGFDNVGVVMQAYLYRTEADIERLINEGAWIRLCKGAYMEPPEIAFPVKADTDANYVKLTKMLLSSQARQNGVYIGIASHDQNMIEAAKQYVKQENIGRDEFEFQMLYGIRRELQEQLVRDGYRMRIYVPYGTAWYPYFTRRLAERPANLWFFMSNFFRG